MILGIDHVGVATDSPAGLEPFLHALGMGRTDAGAAPAYGVQCDFWGFPAGPAPAGALVAALEVVSPLREGSAVSAGLARAGAGPHHLALRVDDVDGELARLRTAGFVAVDRAPCAGARAGMRVAFVYLPKPGGLLVELVAQEMAQEADEAVARCRNT
jgi:methylmalonyl-CoA/ethylmalonyl-CoA epimerase